MLTFLIKNAVFIICIFAIQVHANSLDASVIQYTCPKPISIFAEYLYWYPSEQSDSVWANDIGFPATNHVTYSTPNLKFNWSSGFRGGIAYACPNFWDISLIWTYMPSSRSMYYSVAPFHILTPEFFSGFLSSDTFSSASINWGIQLNSVDVAISHAFHATPTLIIRPHIGIKEATINQTIHSSWNATLFTIPIFTSTETLTNNFIGIGPAIGIKGIWNFCQNFSLAADVTSAFLWGRWNITDTYVRPSALFGLIHPTTINTKMSDAKLGTPVYQFYLGVQWVHESNYEASISLGYEMQYWVNQLRMPTFQLLPLHGDLTLQGVTCGLSISF